MYTVFWSKIINILIAIILQLMLLSSDTLQESIISRLLIVVLIPHKGSTLAGKDTRNPAVLI